MKNQYQVRGDVTAIFLRQPDGSTAETLIDTADLPLLMATSCMWCLAVNLTHGSTYVIASLKHAPGLWKTVYLHRFLLEPPAGLQVDHINRNSLDNRRANLRVVTASKNRQNQGPRRQSPDREQTLADKQRLRIQAIRKHMTEQPGGWPDIFWNAAKQRWYARYCWTSKRMHIGAYRSREDAELAIGQLTAN
jgi:hypothetical protein